MGKSNEAWQSGIAILEDNVFVKKGIIDGSMSIEERRKAERFAITVPLKYRISAYDKWETAESMDVSNTGVRLAAPLPIPVGTKIMLDVLLPHTSDYVRVEGVVVWMGSAPAAGAVYPVYQCGVAFQNLKQLTRKEKLLQFMADKLCGIMLDHSDQKITVAPADNIKDLEDCYRLVYKEYFPRGYCEPNSKELHYSFYCMLPGSRTFALKRDGNLLGTISLIADSECGLPIEQLFPEPVQAIRNEGRKIAEVSLLALDQEAFKKKSFSLTDLQKLMGSFHLFKGMFEYARRAAGITDLLIAVHPKHEDLYRYLEFRPIAEPKPYSSACNKPALPMRFDIDAIDKEVSSKRSVKRFFYEFPLEQKLLERKFDWNAANLRRFLLELKPVWSSVPEWYREQMYAKYPFLRGDL